MQSERVGSQKSHQSAASVVFAASDDALHTTDIDAKKRKRAKKRRPRPFAASVRLCVSVDRLLAALKTKNCL